MATMKSLRFDLSSGWDGAGVREARDDIDKLKADIDTLGNARFKVNMDDAEAIAKWDEFKRRLATLQDKTVRLIAEDAELRARVDEAKAKLAELHDKKIKMEIDQSQADQAIRALETGILNMNRALGDVDRRVNEARSSVASLGRDMESEFGKAQAAADLLGKKMDELAKLRKAKVQAELAGDTAVKARLDELIKQRKAEIRAELQDADVQTKIDVLTRDRHMKIFVEMDHSAVDAFTSRLSFLNGRVANLATGILAVAPAAAQMGGALIGATGAAISGFGGAAAALAPFAGMLFATYKQVANMQQTLSPLNSQLQTDQALMQQNAAGAHAYAAAQQQLNSAQATGASTARASSVAHAQLGVQLAQQRQTLAGLTRGSAAYKAQQQAIAATNVQLAQSTLSSAQASQQAASAHQAAAGSAASARAQMQQYAQANRAYNSAAQDAAKAQTQINQVMAQASPMQVTLYNDLQNLQQAFSDLETKAAPFMTPILDTMFKAATAAVAGFLPVIQAVAPIFQHLADQALKFAQGNGFKSFIEWTSTVGVADLKLVIGIIGNLFGILIGMIRQFAPQGQQFLQWLDNMTGHWNQLVNNGGMQKFANMFTQSWPAITQIVRNLADTIGHLAQAMANLGGAGELSILASLTSLLAKLPVGVVQALAVAFLGLRSALFITDRIDAITNAFGRMASLVERIGGLFSKLADFARGAATAMGLLSAAESADAGAQTALSGAETAGAGAANTDAAAQLRLNAAETAGVGAATADAGAQSGLSAAEKAANPRFLQGAEVASGSMAGVGAVATIAAAAAAIGTAIAAYAHSVDEKTAEANGVILHASGAVTAGATANGQRVSAAYQNMAMTVSGAGNAAGATIQDMGGAAQSRFGSYAQNFKSGNDKVMQVMGVLAHSPNQAASDFAQAAGLFVNAMHGDVAKMGAQVQASGKSLSDTTSQSLMNIFNSGAKATQQGSKGMLDSFNASSKQMWSQMQATSKGDYESLGTATRGFEDDLAHGRTAKAGQDIQLVKSAMQTFEQDYASGRISTTQAQIQKVSADVQAFYAAQSSGDSQKEQAAISKLFQDTQAAYNKDADAADAAQVAADNKMWSDIQQTGTAAAAAAGAAISAAFQAAQNYAALNHQNIGSGNTSQGGHGFTYASGGYISGAGTSTSDSIPAMLSNGEFVVKASAVQQHRSALEAINSGRAQSFAMGGVVGYASGGSVSGSGKTSVDIPDVGGALGLTLQQGFTDASAKGHQSAMSMFQQVSQANTLGYSQMRDSFRQSVASYVQGALQQHQQGVSGQMTQDYRAKFQGFTSSNAAAHQQGIAGVMTQDYRTKFQGFTTANRAAHQQGITGQMQPDYKTKFTAFVASNTAEHQAGIVGKMQPDYKTKFNSYVAASNQTQTTGITLVQTTFKGHFDTMSKSSSTTVQGDISQIGSAAASAASAALGKARGAVSSAASSMGGTFAFAGGGHVLGAGTGTSDSIPAMLSNGEYVISAGAVNRYGVNMMHSINAQHFASGGLAVVPPIGAGYTTADGGAVSAVSENGLGGMDIGTIKQIVKEITANRAKAAAAAAAAAGGGGPAGQGVPSGNLQQWLQAAGIPSSLWGYYATLVAGESGGNPLAFNPSGASGIAQMMPGTFSAYGSGNIWNPVDNLRASYAYVRATYGSPANIPGLGGPNYKGYALGGMVQSDTSDRFAANSAIRVGPSQAWTGDTSDRFAASGGWNWVGERGMELVNFGNGGANVKSFDQIISAMTASRQEGSFGGGVFHIDLGGITVHAGQGGDPEEIANAVVARIGAELIPQIKAQVGQRG